MCYSFKILQEVFPFTMPELILRQGQRIRMAFSLLLPNADNNSFTFPKLSYSPMNFNNETYLKGHQMNIFCDKIESNT